ncbi:Hypothetical protein POVR1_LOCUS356 [uncultured virus]|nr:Hypothetical protein POVR1_LOCUS356 [uncultured virus]
MDTLPDEIYKIIFLGLPCPDIRARKLNAEDIQEELLGEIRKSEVMGSLKILGNFWAMNYSMGEISKIDAYKFQGAMFHYHGPVRVDAIEGRTGGSSDTYSPHFFNIHTHGYSEKYNDLCATSQNLKYDLKTTYDIMVARPIDRSCVKSHLLRMLEKDYRSVITSRDTINFYIYLYINAKQFVLKDPVVLKAMKYPFCKDLETSEEYVRRINNCVNVLYSHLYNYLSKL